MGLKISQGPLANDGQRFNPEADLAAFVSGTRLFDFGHENFADSGVSFIISQTDAPASASVNRGLTWFRRGEGTTYHALFYTPKEGPRSGVTDFKWIAASGSRKEQLVEYRMPVGVPGGILRQQASPEGGVYGIQVMENRFMAARVFQTAFTSHTVMSITSDASASWWGFWSEHYTDPVFVALDASADGCGHSGHDYHVAVECGFAELAVSCSYTGPGKLVLFEGFNDARFQTPTGATFKVTDVECAYALDSKATESSNMAFGFLRPSLFSRNV